MNLLHSNAIKDLFGDVDFQPDTLFEKARVPIIVVDSQCRALSVNLAAKNLLGYGSLHSGVPQTCHQILCKTAKPCPECLLHESDSPSGPRAHTVKNKAGRDCFIREEVLRFPEFNVLILFDVTREITTLKNLDLIRKELKAKNVLLEQRRRVARDERDRTQKLLDQLPEAFIQVDEDCAVIKKNKAAREILPEEKADTCYGLLGSISPCPECPAEKGFTSANGEKVIHQVGRRYLTEHMVQSEGEEGAVLLFRDTTRQIELIEKIREQQNTITRKNDLLSNLVSLQARMQKSGVSEGMIHYFLDMFLPVYSVEEAVVIIDDVRSGCVWLVTSRGPNDSQVHKIVRSYLSRSVQSMASRVIPKECLPWEKTFQQELIGGDGRKVGMLLFPESGTHDDSDLVQLFSEPFGAFIHNRLLQRQLEEKANTDPLTGLYNRGYMDGALASEEEKKNKFGIPYAVMVADVNRLKQANDVYGHEAGDRLILAVSERLKNAVRKTDLVARIGGDEFLILLTDTTDQGAMSLAERLSKDLFRAVSIEVGDSETFPVTVSIGAAGSDRVHHDKLLKMADKRMYEAKEAYYRNHKKYR